MANKNNKHKIIQLHKARKNQEKLDEQEKKHQQKLTQLREEMKNGLTLRGLSHEDYEYVLSDEFLSTVIYREDEDNLDTLLDEYIKFLDDQAPQLEAVALLHSTLHQAVDDFISELKSILKDEQTASAVLLAQGLQVKAAPEIELDDFTRNALLQGRVNKELIEASRYVVPVSIDVYGNESLINALNAFNPKGEEDDNKD
ncbi:MAG: hypothetical protein D8H99_56825 [Streptococcus sp.]|jgi:hypothetical protein|nr:MAG: hypothetical protein D8H99_56825 [Streptococcus sp.]